MPEKKRQHYVPKFYMQLFADKEKKFSVYNIKDNKILDSVPYDNQCYKDYYYGKDRVWEDKLAVLELEWANVMQKLLSKCTLSAEDIKLIKQFALYQRQRTFGEGEFQKQAKREATVEQGKSFYATKGWAFNKRAEDFCIKKADEHITPGETLMFAEKLENIISDLHLLIISYNTKAKLFSSDVPVIAINPFQKQTIGYGCMGLILFFPVSESMLVVIYDDKMYPKFKHELYITSQNEKEVIDLNTLQVISAEKILFANNPRNFDNCSNNSLDVRNKNRSKSAISTFGSPPNKMTVYGQRTTLYKCNFSFGLVRKDFDDIPYPCREAVPRAWEKGWEKKLKDKILIMPQIVLLQKDVMKSLGLTSKETRRGCTKMLTSAKKYWRGM